MLTERDFAGIGQETAPKPPSFIKEVSKAIEKVPQWKKQAFIGGWISASAFFLFIKIFGYPGKK